MVDGDPRSGAPQWLHPDEIAEHPFAWSLRGFDAGEVRTFLTRVAEELRAAAEREAELVRLLDAVPPPEPPPEPLGEDDFVDALGAETARVLQAAHLAANEVRARAGAEADRVRATAAADAARMLSEARAAAKEMREDAASILDVRSEEAEQAAARIMSEAEAVLAVRSAEAERVAEGIRLEGRKAADAEIEMAKAEGRKLVQEAQAVRERVLRDLARRRRHAHQQLEQLRAGRERLLAAYRVVRGTLEEATRELSVAEVEARAAAEAAALKTTAEREPTIIELEAELAAAHDADLPIVGPSSTSDAARGSPADEAVADEPPDHRDHGAALGAVHPDAPADEHAAGDDVAGPTRARAFGRGPTAPAAREPADLEPAEAGADVDPTIGEEVEERRSSAVRIFRRRHGPPAPIVGSATDHEAPSGSPEPMAERGAAGERGASDERGQEAVAPGTERMAESTPAGDRSSAGQPAPAGAGDVADGATTEQPREETAAGEDATPGEETAAGEDVTPGEVAPSGTTTAPGDGPAPGSATTDDAVPPPAAEGGAETAASATTDDAVPTPVAAEGEHEGGDDRETGAEVEGVEAGTGAGGSQASGAVDDPPTDPPTEDVPRAEAGTGATAGEPTPAEPAAAGDPGDSDADDAVTAERAAAGDAGDSDADDAVTAEPAAAGDESRSSPSGPEAPPSGGGGRPARLVTERAPAPGARSGVAPSEAAPPAARRPSSRPPPSRPRAAPAPAAQAGRVPVDDLFARLRAEREAAVAKAEHVLASPARPGAGARSSSREGGTTTGASTTPVEAALRPDSPEADESVLQRRDAAIEAVDQRVLRALKRVLADEQNDVLDRLRRYRGAASVDALVPVGEEHAERFRTAVREPLRAAADAGAHFAGGSPSTPADVDDLVVALGDDIAGPLRSRLDRSLREVPSADQQTVSETVSACYREWKSQRLEPVARHHTAAAFARGAFAATPTGTAMRWVVDDDDGGCPDCDDNALAGAVASGEPFPTGQLHPPAHAGCRCLLVRHKP